MKTIFLASVGLLFTLAIAIPAKALEKGIYITQSTLEDNKRINYLMKRAKNSGINTFVIDYERASKKYNQNITLVQDNGFHYVARVVIFPDGAKSKAQMFSESYREKKFNLMKQAIALGADEIQMDYIRYNSKTKSSPQNAQDVNATIQWYKNKLKPYNVPLQIDVFGITSFHPENRIGQYPKVFAGSVDSINPMVYPSHYEPFRQASAQPYKTVHSSLISLKEQLKDQPPVKIRAFIEAYNYRYPLSRAQKGSYALAQIKAAEDAKVDGWYFWSANNHYDHVFSVLQARPQTAQMAD